MKLRILVPAASAVTLALTLLFPTGTPASAQGAGGDAIVPVAAPAAQAYAARPAWGDPRWTTRWAHNRRCDDPRYNTSNGGQADPGTDEWDCSRYGGGLKDRYLPSGLLKAWGDGFAGNGRCDDPRYTVTTGRAEPGGDEYDCSRQGGGLQ